MVCISDLRTHPMFRGSPLVTGAPFLRAYAGCVIRSASLTPIGTFCLFDTTPRDFPPDQVSLLRGFAQSAADYLSCCVPAAEPTWEMAMRHLVECADIALSVGDRAEAEHLVHLAYRLFDERA